jgi:hypothetical protein
MWVHLWRLAIEAKLRDQPCEGDARVTFDGDGRVWAAATLAATEKDTVLG